MPLCAMEARPHAAWQLQGGGALPPASSGAASTSPQAVRGVGPHKGVAPRRLLPAPQHGYERERSDRIEPCVSFLARETCLSLEFACAVPAFTTGRSLTARANSRRVVERAAAGAVSEGSR